MIKKDTCDRCGQKAITYLEITDNGQIIWVCENCAKVKAQEATNGH